MNVPEGDLQSILPIQYSQDVHMTPRSDGQTNKETAVPTRRENIIYGGWLPGREGHRGV